MSMSVPVARLFTPNVSRVTPSSSGRVGLRCGASEKRWRWRRSGLATDNEGHSGSFNGETDSSVSKKKRALSARKQSILSREAIVVKRLPLEVRLHNILHHRSAQRISRT
eukprot:1393651-Pyramimonas_sp.AAC.2